jgi:hypothetical protein
MRVLGGCAALTLAASNGIAMSNERSYPVLQPSYSRSKHAKSYMFSYVTPAAEGIKPRADGVHALGCTFSSETGLLHQMSS